MHPQRLPGRGEAKETLSSRSLRPRAAVWARPPSRRCCSPQVEANYRPRRPAAGPGAKARRCMPGVVVRRHCACAPLSTPPRPSRLSFCPRRPLRPASRCRHVAPRALPPRGALVPFLLARRGGACGGTRKRRREAVSLATPQESGGPVPSACASVLGAAAAAPGGAGSGRDGPEPGLAAAGRRPRP